MFYAPCFSNGLSFHHHSVTDITNALRAFSEDSQAGTGMARLHAGEGASVEFSEEEQTQIHDILSKHPVIQHSDYRLPDVLLSSSFSNTL